MGEPLARASSAAEPAVEPERPANPVGRFFGRRKAKAEEPVREEPVSDAPGLEATAAMDRIEPDEVDTLKAWAEAGMPHGDGEPPPRAEPDAINFVGWYTDVSQKKLGISKWNPYQQYLAYHEGWGGYSRGSFNKKQHLLRVANKVQKQAETYNAQLKTCSSDLDDAISGWF